VIASGVAMFVMYLSNFESLRRTQQAYYDQQRFADIFVNAKRVPNRLAERLAEIRAWEPSTRACRQRDPGPAGVEVPARGRLISIPPPAVQG